MANRIPLVIANGRFQQQQSVDTLYVPGLLHVFKSSGNTSAKVETTDVAGYSELILDAAGVYADFYADAGSGDVALTLAPGAGGLSTLAVAGLNPGDLDIYAGLGKIITIGAQSSSNDIIVKNANNGNGLTFDTDGTATGSPGSPLGTVGINQALGTHGAFLHINNSAGAAVAVNKSLRIDLAGTETFSILRDGTVQMAEIAAPATPASGYGRLYVKSDGLLYFKNDAGTEYDLTSTGGGMSIGGTVSSGTTGSILFVGSGPVLAQDNANLFWDDTNNRLGVGTNALTAKVNVLSSDLEVVGRFSSSHPSTSTVLFVENTNSAATPEVVVGNNTGAAYWLFGVGGSTHSSTLFGSSLANVAFMLATGASTTSAKIGSAINIPVILGVNDSERARLTSTEVRVVGVPFEVPEIGAPATPSSGYGRIYAKSDGLLYFKNDAGTEFDLTASGTSLTPRQESVTTQNITGTDTALTDTLDFTPVSNASVMLFLNGVFQRQGATFDYTISGTTITWLAATGTAVDMTTSDVLIAVYTS